MPDTDETTTESPPTTEAPAATSPAQAEPPVVAQPESTPPAETDKPAPAETSASPEVDQAEIARQIEEQTSKRVEAAAKKAADEARAQVKAEMKAAAEREAMSERERLQADLDDANAKVAAAEEARAAKEAEAAAKDAQLEIIRAMGDASIKFPVNGAGTPDPEIERIACQRIASKREAAPSMTTAQALAAVQAESPHLFAVSRQPAAATSTGAPGPRGSSVAPVASTSITPAENCFKMTPEEFRNAVKREGLVH